MKLEEMCIHDVQKAELYILKEIDEICSRNNICYWGMYGTLIGSIRHKGFIPWDDDLDIAIKREDYEKFIEYFSCEYKGNLEIHLPDNKQEYPFYIARVCDKNHILKFKDYDYISGVFIDIYPFDGLGSEKDKRFWHEKQRYIKIIKKCLEATMYNGIIGNTFLKKIINLPLELYSRYKGKSYFVNLIDELSKTYTWENSVYVGLPVWANNLYFHDKHDFDDFIYVDFEDIKIQIPLNYDKILKEIYGNYMCLPPKEKQLPQHGYKAYKKYN